MKKFFYGLMLVILALVVLSSCTKNELKVYLPTEYISQDLVDEFEEQNGVRVNLIEFMDNETAIPQIESGSFDVVIPSDYAIEELASKGLLKALDWSKITGFDKDEDFDPELLTVIDKLQNDESLGDNGFDLLEYAAPYFWGNLGILYDKNQVEDAGLDLESLGWDVLAHASNNFQVSLYESARDMFLVAIKHVFEVTGSDSSVNAPTASEIAQAQQWLIGLANQNYSRWNTDEIYDEMLDPATYGAAVAYSGQAIWLMSENENLGYFVPSEGTNVFIDAMCIPENAKNEDLAYKFISFFLEYENQYANSEEWGYTSVRGDVVEAIVLDEVYLEESYVIHVGPKDEIFRYNPALKDIISEVYFNARG